MVKATGNIFFDINNQNFSIIGVDTTPPMASANTNDINGPNFTSLFFSVDYTDNQAVDASDIGPGDVEIVAPDNSILPRQLYQPFIHVTCRRLPGTIGCSLLMELGGSLTMAPTPFACWRAR